MLKIPWKNLYTAPVVVLVERLHLLAVPSQGVAYNREKEDATARDLRKQQLSRYERRQQLADSKCDRPVPPPDRETAHTRQAERTRERPIGILLPYRVCLKPASRRHGVIELIK